MNHKKIINNKKTPNEIKYKTATTVSLYLVELKRKMELV